MPLFGVFHLDALAIKSKFQIYNDKDISYYLIDGMFSGGKFSILVTFGKTFNQKTFTGKLLTGKLSTN
jgi:hypothetical protein